MLNAWEGYAHCYYNYLLNKEERHYSNDELIHYHRISDLYYCDDMHGEILLTNEWTGIKIVNTYA